MTLEYAYYAYLLAEKYRNKSKKPKVDVLPIYNDPFSISEGFGFDYYIALFHFFFF